MRITVITALILTILCSSSYGLDRNVREANKKLAAMDKIKTCDYYKFEPRLRNGSYVTKAILYEKFQKHVIVEGAILDYRGCIDVDDDGIPEAVITDYNRAVAGAPVFLKHIYKLQKGKIELLQTILGEFGEDAAFVDLNKDGKTEIMTYAISLWGDLNISDNPALLEIYCYRDNKIIDCTKEFPEIIKREIASTLKEAQAEAQDYKINPGRTNEELEEFIKGHAMQYLHLHILLGQEQKGWDGIKEYFPSAYTWVKKDWAN